MPTLTEHLEDVADALVGAGVAATIDPRDVAVPGAWVVLAGLDHDLLGPDTEATMRVRVYLIAPDAGTRAALDCLSGLLWHALTVLGPNADTPTTPTEVSLPDTAPLPALVVTLTTPVTLDPDPA